MTRFAALALALAATLTACNDKTGIAVRVEVPVGFPPEDGFDSIKVNVINRDQQVFSEPAFPVTKSTKSRTTCSSGSARPRSRPSRSTC